MAAVQALARTSRPVRAATCHRTVASASGTTTRHRHPGIPGSSRAHRGGMLVGGDREGLRTDRRATIAAPDTGSTELMTGPGAAGVDSIPAIAAIALVAILARGRRVATRERRGSTATRERRGSGATRARSTVAPVHSTADRPVRSTGARARTVTATPAPMPAAAAGGARFAARVAARARTGPATVDLPGRRVRTSFGRATGHEIPGPADPDSATALRRGRIATRRFAATDRRSGQTTGARTPPPGDRNVTAHLANPTIGPHSIATARDRRATDSARSRRTAGGRRGRLRAGRSATRRRARRGHPAGRISATATGRSTVRGRHDRSGGPRRDPRRRSGEPAGGRTSLPTTRS